MEPEWFEQGVARADHERFGFTIIKLCRGRLHEKDFYAYVSIEPENLRYFEDHYKDGQSCNFQPFGRELLRGWGKRPPEDIIEHLKFKYNIEFDVEPDYIKHLANIASEVKEKPDILHSPFPDKRAGTSIP